jgi:hypothetical protein
VPVRECTVSFLDGRRGLRHSTTVYAGSVLEAAALGLKQLRETSMLDDVFQFQNMVAITATMPALIVLVITPAVMSTPLFKSFWSGVRSASMALLFVVTRWPCANFKGHARAARSVRVQPNRVALDYDPT